MKSGGCAFCVAIGLAGPGRRVVRLECPPIRSFPGAGLRLDGIMSPKPLSSFRFRVLAALVAAIFLLPPVVGFGALSSRVVAPAYRLSWPVSESTAGDLSLDEQGCRMARVYRDFAWGVYLLNDPKASKDEALASLASALDEVPESETVLGHVVGPLMKGGDFDAIADRLLPIAVEHPKALRLNMVAVEALTSLERFDEAVEVLSACGDALDWSDVALVRRAAVLYWKADRRDELGRLLKRVLRDEEMRDRFDVQYTCAMYFRSRYDQAVQDAESSGGDGAEGRRAKKIRRRMVAHAQKAVRRIGDAEKASDIARLADLLEEHKRWQSLADMLDTVASVPRFSSPQLRLLHARSLIEMGENDAAIEMLDGIAASTGAAPGVTAETARLFVSAGALERASRVYESLLRLPEVPEERLIRALGYLYLRLDRPQEVIRLVSGEETPGGTRLQLLASAYRRLGDFEQAYETFQRMLTLSEEKGGGALPFARDSEQFLLFAGTICDEAGRYKESIRWAEEALEHYPDSAMSQNFLGYTLADRNRQLERAASLIERALGQAPDNVAYLDSLAWVQYRRGENRAALRTILRVLRLNVGLSGGVILDHAGDICSRCGLSHLACRYWQEAVASVTTERFPAMRKRIRNKLAGVAATSDRKGGEPGSRP